MNLSVTGPLGLNLGFWYIAFPLIIFLLMCKTFKMYRESEQRECEKRLNLNDEQLDLLDDIACRNDKKAIFKYMCKLIDSNENE